MPISPKYPFSDQITARLENDYCYHAPIGDQVERYQAIRDKAKELAYLIVGSTPYSREQSVALTNLEQAVMMANAAIARNETPSNNEARSGYDESDLVVLTGHTAEEINAMGLEKVQEVEELLQKWKSFRGINGCPTLLTALEYRKLPQEIKDQGHF